ncbi:hydrolase [Xanthomonas fragariae]|uniref:Hydrolase n=1 Tax=Xanthomonas fragariae TaxID=48664 RepID=A0A1Y6GU72_9XANT|nr:alpha/beta fold hydrolase [Xanthomonas fragariae]ENZ95423.1 hypothetical protein O1K_09982 [Xanthomonas fragariae LMG 25863]SMQ93791.1 hydrolase [Xanthomonas fragariae]SMQ97620.1 Alpha/beta hydrolase family protein [Xanthomonas fragariae]SMR04917.1 hydrolase [Xanthomonas fragariae]
MTFRITCLLLLLLVTAALQAQPHPGPGTQLSQVHADDGRTLAVWSRVPAQPRGTVLLVHGRTWSSLPNFDLQVLGEPPDSRSVLAALAQAGYAAYAVDLRGYGGTVRDPSGWNTPERAVADVCDVLVWIAHTHPGLAPSALLGYSNGARVALLMRPAWAPMLSAATTSLRRAGRALKHTQRAGCMCGVWMRAQALDRVWDQVPCMVSAHANACSACKRFTLLAA